MIRKWQPRANQAELALCQRFYEKTFDPDTAPGTAIQNGAIILQVATAGNALFEQSGKFCTPKRTTPTITLYDISGNSGKIQVQGVGANQTGTASGIGTGAFSVLTSATPGAGATGLLFHLTADAGI